MRDAVYLTDLNTFLQWQQLRNEYPTNTITRIRAGTKA